MKRSILLEASDEVAFVLVLREWHEFFSGPITNQSEVKTFQHSNENYSIPLVQINMLNYA